jgi:glycosyltransferase involved in cell wall biosynthesis
MAINALFLTHSNALKSDVTGGVQLCSQEFHHIISLIDDINLIDYFVPYTKKVTDRLLIRIGFENYSMYNIENDIQSLLEFIKNNKIDVVFINMASMVRYSKKIKQWFGSNIKIILLSHGNHSGDFLHLITKPVKKVSWLKDLINRIRIGFLITTESEHRVKYLDAVITLSETEKQIENWFGAPISIFMPRRLYTNFLPYSPILGRIGFVGRLDHPPNFQGIQILFDSIQKQDFNKLEIRLVGAPESYGEIIQKKYPFVNYLGELSDEDLEKEVNSWAFLLNPVWWYSTGASTKLAKAISWGIPIVSTTAGKRGYFWKDGELPISDTPDDMARFLLHSAGDKAKLEYWSEQTKTIAKNGLSDQELALLIKSTFVS